MMIKGSITNTRRTRINQTIKLSKNNPANSFLFFISNFTVLFAMPITKSLYFIICWLSVISISRLKFIKFPIWLPTTSRALGRYENKIPSVRNRYQAFAKDKYLEPMFGVVKNECLFDRNYYKKLA